MSCAGNALASRIYVKQLNKKVQNAILYKVEPLASLLAMTGVEYPKNFLDIAWKYILHAHCHDSIHACTQDKTAEDNVYRLNQAMEIAEVVYERSLAEMIKHIDLSKYDIETSLLVVFNPLPFPVKDVITVDLDIPRKYNTWNVKIKDSEDRDVETQSISREETVATVHDLHARPWSYSVDRHRLCMDSGLVPACGYKVFSVETPNEFYRGQIPWPPLRTKKDKDISLNHSRLERYFQHYQ